MTTELPPVEEYDYRVDRRFLRDLEALVQHERAQVGKTIRLLSRDPRHPGLRCKKLHAAKQGEIWEARVDQAHRLLYQWVNGMIYLWRVGPHDVIDEAARLGQPDLSRAVAPEGPMPAGTAAVPPALAPVTVAPPGPFERFSPTLLQLLGVPEKHVDAVRALRDPEQVWDLNLPKDVLSTLLDILTRPDLHEVMFDPARLLFRATADQLAGYCEGRIKRLLLNLDPVQEQYVRLQTRGPFLLRGVAGSGKTTIGIYRARARAAARDLFTQGGRVLFLTYNRVLADTVRELFAELYGRLPDGIEVDTVDRWLLGFCRQRGHPVRVDLSGTQAELRAAIDQVRATRPHVVLRRLPAFFEHELDKVIKGRGVATREEYLAIDRVGTGTGLGEAARHAVWDVYEAYQRRLEDRGLMDFGDVRLLALHELETRPEPRYDEVVVDEAQDLVPVQLRAVRHLARGNNIFLLADAAQSIYYRGISWRDAGMDVVGRARVLKTNYRNTAEVVCAANSLIAHSPTLVKHGEYVPPKATRAHGPRPVLIACATEADHARVVRQEVVRLCRGDTGQRYRPGDIAVLAPTRAWCVQVHGELINHDIPCRVRTDNERFSVLENEVKVLTIHSAKGIEFPVVFVVGLTHNPPQPFPRVDYTAPPPEREAELDASRRLLYVGMTRAAERLYLLTTRGAPSLFLREIEPATLVSRDAP